MISVSVGTAMPDNLHPNAATEREAYLRDVYARARNSGASPEEAWAEREAVERLLEEGRKNACL